MNTDHSAALAHYQAQAALAELQRLQGVGLKPQPGCKLVEMALGDATVLVEYEYSPGRPGRYSGPPERCYPDEPAELCVLNVLINGCMVDAQECVAPDVLERWEQQIADSEIEAAADQDEGPEDHYDFNWADDYLSDKAADKYEAELDARASQ
jgi:hypothetical protein